MVQRNTADLIKDVLGAETFSRSNPEASSIGVAASVILKNNPARVAFTVINLSTNEVYIGPFGNVATTKGIRLAPSGGQASYLYSEDFNIVTEEWWAIATGAASQVLVIDQVLART